MDISQALPDNMILTASEFTDVPTVWISSDGGASWVDRTTNLPDPPRYLERVVCHPTEPGTMFVVRTGFGSGKIYRTTDLGVSWTNISGDLPDIPHNDVFVDPENVNTIYVANDFGVYRSTDQGITWTRQGSGMPYVPVMDFDYASYDTVRYLRVGTHGRSAFQATLPPPTDVADQDDVAYEFSLFQNYPNPFNPSTHITYQVPLSGHVRLEVFDVLGREVATLVDEIREPGEFSVTFDGSPHSSGVYFSRLAAGGFTQTRKLLLLK
jgi:hypothetical protein